MGNIKILSRSGYQDLNIWREQALNINNSSTKMSWDGVKFDMTAFTLVELNVHVDPEFDAAAPILIFATSNGRFIPLNGGFYLSCAEAVTDIVEDTYYYSLLGDGELLLSGKFVISEYAKTE